MQKGKTINNVSNVCFCNNHVIIVGNNKYQGNGIRSKAEFGMCSVFCLSDKVLVQYKQFGKIDIFNLSGVQIETLDLNLNLYSQFTWNDKVVLASQKTKTYWSINRDIELEDLKFYKHYVFQIKSHFYSVEHYNGTFNLVQYDFNTTNSNWKTELLGNIYLDSGQGPLGDSEKIYLPFENHLVCINANTGEEIWEIKSSYSFDVDDHLVIQNRGDSIVEIDKKTGVKLRTITYRETQELSNFNSTGPIWIFEKYICVANTLSGTIVLIKKGESIHIETFDLGIKIPNDKKSIRMKGESLYILDSQNKLHIIEKDFKDTKKLQPM